MKELIRFDTKFTDNFCTGEELCRIKEDALKAKEILDGASGAGNDFLGWVDLPAKADREEIARIKKCAEKIASDSDVLLVIGIGGSYLGARAAIEFLSHSFSAGMHRAGRDQRTPEICFVGQTVTADYVSDLKEYLEGVDWSINVISKSGTTTECSVAFRIFRSLLEERYGRKGAAARIYATTDRERGALRTLAEAEGYERFVIPDDVGGRYSVLTAVGLLPIAAAGIDIDAMMEGAAEMRELAMNAPFDENGPVRYAAVRNLLYRNGKKTEIFASDGPYFHFLAEWWKQLYGESEGKDGKGIFPSSAEFTTDLHSLGQYIQDGERTLMETVHTVDVPWRDMPVPAGDALDGLSYLEGRPLDEVRKCAIDATCLAHTDGGVPVMRIRMTERSARSLGQFFYFYEYACGVSGYMLRVNPFNQPGVEAYKKNMFALLGKPGYDEMREEILERLS